MIKFFWNKGFTLAEVLITLGVIGIVAALTLPSLIAHYRLEQSIERLKKAYSVLNQAYKSAEIDYGDISNWDWTLSSKDFLNRYFVPYLKITENCEDKYTSVCWNSEGVIYYLNGSKGDFITGSYYSKIKLIDGTLVAFVNQNSSAHFYIDTNGVSKPNTDGKDIFVLTLTKDKYFEYGVHDIKHAGLWFFGSGVEKNKIESNCSIINNGSNNGHMCGAWIFQNGWQIPNGYPRY